MPEALLLSSDQLSCLYALNIIINMYREAIQISPIENVKDEKIPSYPYPDIYYSSNFY